MYEAKSTATPDGDVLAWKGKTFPFLLTEIVPSDYAEVKVKCETGHKTLIELKLDVS